MLKEKALNKRSLKGKLIEPPSTDMYDFQKKIVCRGVNKRKVKTTKSQH